MFNGVGKRGKPLTVKDLRAFLNDLDEIFDDDWIAYDGQHEASEFVVCTMQHGCMRFGGEQDWISIMSMKNPAKFKFVNCEHCNTKNWVRK